MPDLLKLPLRAIDLATRPTRFVLGKLLELGHSDDDQVVAPVETPRPEPPQSAPPAAARPKPPARPSPSPKAVRRATRHEPTRGEAGRIRQQEHMEEQEAGGVGGDRVGATIEVAAPWDGYDAMTEDQVLDRLTGAEPAVRAIVRLYESTHGGRRQILIATEEQTVEP